MRKTHLQKTILDAVAQLRERQMPVRVVDIAAGHGRYVQIGRESCREG